VGEAVNISVGVADGVIVYVMVAVGPKTGSGGSAPPHPMSKRHSMITPSSFFILLFPSCYPQYQHTFATQFFNTAISQPLQIELG
jgi:hypothetical protein